MNKAEKKTVAKMIRIYCRAKHGTTQSLCVDCMELNKYAQRRLSTCPFGEDKPTCKTCKIHCYRKDIKERMQCVMRFSGPRMIFHSPILAIKHLYKELK